MNKTRLLETVVIGGALTGLLLWFMFGNNNKSSQEMVETSKEQAQSLDKKMAPDKTFSTLEKSDKMPAEVNDTTVKELDSYIMDVDSTGMEDLTDLE